MKIYMQILKLFILLILPFFFVGCSSDKIKNDTNNKGIPNKKEASTDLRQTTLENQKTPALSTQTLASTSVKSPVCEGSISELTINLCTKKDLSWLSQADTQDSYIRIVDDQVIWVRGTWKNGDWYGDIWLTGTWEKGVWHHGAWVDGLWHQGTWKIGYWKDGFWRGGLWNEGTWEDGTWADGVWMTGIWKDGYWRGGVWQNGLWMTGVWHKGTWNGGTWENGHWWGGIWNGGIWKIGKIYWYDKPNRFNWIISRNPPSTHTLD